MESDVLHILKITSFLQVYPPLVGDILARLNIFFVTNDSEIGEIGVSV